MKKINHIMVAVAVLALCASTTARAWDLIPLDSVEAANKGANVVAYFTQADLTLTTTNSAQAFTNATAAGEAWEAVAIILDGVATDWTNHTGSLALTVGDGSDPDLFFTSTELAEDGTEVLVKLPPYTNSATVAYVTTTNLLLGASTNVTTNIWVSSVAAPAATGLGAKQYSTAGSIVFTFTPNAENSVSMFTNTAVRVLFRKYSAHQ